MTGDSILHLVQLGPFPIAFVLRWPISLCVLPRQLLRWQNRIHWQSSQSSFMKTGVRLTLKWFSRPNCWVKISAGATYRYVIFPWDQMICCLRSSWFFLSIRCYSGHHIFLLGLHANPPGVLAKFFSSQVHNWEDQWCMLYRHSRPPMWTPMCRWNSRLLDKIGNEGTNWQTLQRPGFPLWHFHHHQLSVCGDQCHLNFTLEPQIPLA